MPKVIGLTYTNENQALAFTTQCWCNRFGYEQSIPAETIDLQDADGLARLQNALTKGDIDFCFGVQGVGSRLTMPDGKSLWTHYKTPFLGLHHDNPSCNIYNHFCDSPYVANLYAFGCLYDIQQGYIKNNQLNARMSFEIDPRINEPHVPFIGRPIKFSFMKSGKNPNTYADNISQITQPLRDAVWGVIAKAEANENLLICDLLAEAFRSCGHDYTQFWAEFWGFADWIDNYIRCKRAADLVNWLKFQDGAVIIGNGWDFIDKDGARAQFKPSIPAEEALIIYEHSQFIFNTSPYGSDIIHERIFLGLCYYSYVISDTNAWWDKNFEDVPSLCRFHWGRNIGEQILSAMNDPQAAEKVESGIGGRRVIEKLGGKTQLTEIIEIAGRIRSFAQSQSA